MGLRMNTMWNTLKSGIAKRAARFARGGLAFLCALSMALVPAEIAVAGDARLVKIDQGGSCLSQRAMCSSPTRKLSMRLSARTGAPI
jgi:hypothetical protein